MRTFLNRMKNPLIIYSLFSSISNVIWLVFEILPHSLRKLFFKCLFKEFGKDIMLDYRCYFRYPWRVKIGNNVSINRGCEFYSSMRSEQGYITIEDNVFMGPRVTVFSAGHDYSSIKLPDTSAPVIIRKYVWVGGNTTILPGVVIGEGAVIGAGSLVTKSIPPFAIAVGNPAKVIKMRVLKDNSVNSVRSELINTDHI